MKKKQSIIYVNFSPYENAGKILDFLLEEFISVVVFSFNFHQLGKGQKPGRVLVYKDGTIIKTYTLFQMKGKIPVSLIFLLIPLRSSINFLQVLWYAYRLKKIYGTFDYYFTVNAFTAWIGNVLRYFGIVKKTVFWVWDYYPPLHPNKIILFMRWLYWQFDKNVTTTSDKVVFLNKRLEDLRKDINIIPLHKTYQIVPIGTDPLHKTRGKKIDRKKLIIGFLGVLKKAQGLDMFFDCGRDLKKIFPNMTLEILGSGPDETYFKNRAKKNPLTVRFHGYIPDDKTVKDIQKNWDIGIALYIPEESNVSYYTDPSKIKGYLSLGIPVIITNITFAKEVKKEHAGIIIDYGKKEQLIKGITDILDMYLSYEKNALSLAKKYYYKQIYQKIFEF